MMLRRSLARSVLALFAGLATLPMALAAPAVGQPAPDFTLTDTAGKTVRLSEFKGRHVVLEWVNPGCPYVRKHYQSANMQGTQKEVTGKGVVWLAINSTEAQSYDYLAPDKLAGWMTRQKAAPTRTLMDPEGTVGRAYGARTTPHLYVIDTFGKLAYAGAIDSKATANPADIAGATNHVNVALSELLAGKPVTVAQTRAYGCSVKYDGAL